MRKISIVFGLAAAISACGPATVNGKIAGNELVARDSVLFTVKNESTGAVESVAVIISDTVGLCDRIKKRDRLKNEMIAGIQVVQRVDNNAVTPAIGDFQINSATGNSFRSSGVSFAKFDTAGERLIPANQSTAVSGIVKVSAFTTNTNISGTFDITVGTQSDKVTGSFSANECSAKIVDFYASIGVNTVGASSSSNISGEACDQLDRLCQSCSGSTGKSTCNEQVYAARKANSIVDGVGTKACQNVIDANTYASNSAACS